MRSLLACVLLTAACGAPTSTPPPRPITQTQTRTTPPPPPNPNGPTEAECNTLLAHAVTVVTNERAPKATEEDRTTVQTELRPGFVEDCRAGTRAYHQCGLAAQTIADLEACKPTRP